MFFYNVLLKKSSFFMIFRECGCSINNYHLNKINAKNILFNYDE